MSSNKSFNRILIIDDDKASVFLTKVVLEDMNIAEQILTANNGREGLKQIKDNCLNAHASSPACPDLILLDINMPVMDGFEVLNELHQIGQTNLIQAKVVVLTTSSNPHDIKKMKSFGIKDYLEKPVSEDKILPLIPKAN